MTTAEEYVAALPAHYRACKGFNHVYDLSLSTSTDLAYNLKAVHLVCGRCGAKRQDVYRFGRRVEKPTYEPPEGYMKPKDTEAPTRIDYRVAALDAVKAVPLEELSERFQERAHAAERKARPVVTSAGKARKRVKQ